jgi:hypothetical protein
MENSDYNIIKYLKENNGTAYNLHKAAEECQELGLVLTQSLLKSDKVQPQKVIDEIGDVIIRLEILKLIYPIKDIEARIKYKLSKYREYIDHEKYKNI